MYVRFAVTNLHMKTWPTRAAYVHLHLASQQAPEKRRPVHKQNNMLSAQSVFYASMLGSAAQWTRQRVRIRDLLFKLLHSMVCRKHPEGAPAMQIT